MGQVRNWNELSGLEMVQGVLDGSLKSVDPITETMNFKMVEVSEGFCAFEGQPLQGHQNLGIHTHGGWLMSILDSAAVMALITTLPPGVVCATSTFEMKFIRPVTAGMKCRAEGRLISNGKTLGHAEGRLINLENGKLLGSCTCSCSYIDTKKF